MVKHMFSTSQQQKTIKKKEMKIRERERVLEWISEKKMRLLYRKYDV